MGSEKEELKVKIAGEIVLSESPGSVIRKWRNIFRIQQKKLALAIGVKPSVISDYEADRRKSPGTKIINKIVNAIVDIGFMQNVNFEHSESDVHQEKSRASIVNAIIDMKEFLEPIDIIKFCKTIKADLLTRIDSEKKIFGYTIIDSISAIVNLPASELVKIYGANPRRALIFTKVTTGKGPLIAIKVTSPKPELIVLHGLEKVDPVALDIAKSENIALAISRVESVEKLINDLKKLSS
ncbi:MAG: helix-turn-helix domain-containing protein [Candidatus Aenigmatarchaeota archaeon]|nr:helix-turn-helix domain-containing protein [Candidatus Aenigmarchaeota archaeon]